MGENDIYIYIYIYISVVSDDVPETINNSTHLLMDQAVEKAQDLKEGVGEHTPIERGTHMGQYEYD